MKRIKMKKIVFTSVVLFLVYMIMLCMNLEKVFAAHPLISDDTGTQGKGNSSLEFNIGYDHDSERDSKADNTEIALALSYGILEKSDIVLRVPYLSTKSETEGFSVSESGLSDIILEIKYRFYAKDGLSFALKPGITFPAGDDEKGLGSGMLTYSLFFISTKEYTPIAVHLNAGFMRNENKSGEEENLWHVSIATETKISEKNIFVANIGQEKNPEKASDKNPAFILGGIIYSVNEKLDIDLGIKGGINRAEADYSILTGITYNY